MKIPPSTSKALQNLPKTSYKTRAWQGFQKLVEPFDAPPPPSAGEQGSLINIIQGAFGEQLEERSTTKPVNQHFEGLFAGLGAITDRSSNLTSMKEPALLKMIAASRDETTLLKVFNELYYHGKLSYTVALHILKHKSVRNVDELCKAVAYGGGSLAKWDNTQRHLFRLQAANRFFALGKKQQAKELIIDAFDNEWVPVMEKVELDSRSFVGLGRALLAMNGRQLLLDQLGKFNPSTFGENLPIALANLFIPLWVACIHVNDFDAARAVVDSAVRLGNPTEQMAVTPFLFIRYLFILHDQIRANPDLESCVKTLRMDKELVTLPVDVEKRLDAAMVINMLNLLTKLQKNGFDGVVGQEIELLDSHLQHALAAGQSYEMISLALAVQKMQVLKQKSPSPGAQTATIHNSKLAYVPVV